MLGNSFARLAAASALLSCAAVLDLACGGSDYLDGPAGPDGSVPDLPEDASTDAAPGDATIPSDARDASFDADVVVEASFDATADADAFQDADADAELDATADAEADADVPVFLGRAAKFAVLGQSAVTITGLTTAIIGDLGVNSATPIAVIPPGQPIGDIYQGGPVTLGAQADLTVAYNLLAGEPCLPANALTGQDLGGKVLPPGTYCFTSSAQLTGTLVFDAQGDPNAKWTIQIASTLTTATDSVARVVGGGSGCNVYWQVGTSATIGTRTALVGNIVSAVAITLVSGSIVAPGRALARGTAVTLDTNTVSAFGCPVD